MISTAIFLLPCFAAGPAYGLAVKRQVSGLFGVDADKNKLTFDANGGFKIVSFSDMHFGERNGDGTWAQWGPDHDTGTNGVHTNVLATENPNFVVFNGDIVTGENMVAEANNATAYQDMCYLPTVHRGIPFSSTHGNHDNANHVNHKMQIVYVMQHYGGRSGLSYTRSDAGPAPYGNGNYWVPVYGEVGDDVPALIIWAFDSQEFTAGTGLANSGTVPADARESWVDSLSVPAYITSQTALMKATWKGVIPPALVFVHIPPSAGIALSKSTVLQGNQDAIPPPSQGQNDATGQTGLDGPWFQALVDMDKAGGSVLAIVSGHNHGDSYCASGASSSQIPLCFDGHSGMGGKQTPSSMNRNGRVFELSLTALKSSPPTVLTWNSFNDATTADHVTLGPSFSTD